MTTTHRKGSDIKQCKCQRCRNQGRASGPQLRIHIARKAYRTRIKRLLECTTWNNVDDIDIPHVYSSRFCK